MCRVCVCDCDCKSHHHNIMPIHCHQGFVSLIQQKLFRVRTRATSPRTRAQTPPSAEGGGVRVRDYSDTSLGPRPSRDSRGSHVRVWSRLRTRAIYPRLAMQLRSRKISSCPAIRRRRQIGRRPNPPTRRRTAGKTRG